MTDPNYRDLPDDVRRLVDETAGEIAAAVTNDAEKAETLAGIFCGLLLPLANRLVAAEQRLAHARATIQAKVDHWKWVRSLAKDSSDIALCEEAVDKWRDLLRDCFPDV